MAVSGTTTDRRTESLQGKEDPLGQTTNPDGYNEHFMHPQCFISIAAIQFFSRARFFGGR